MIFQFGCSAFRGNRPSFLSVLTKCNQFAIFAYILTFSDSQIRASKCEACIQGKDYETDAKFRNALSLFDLCFGAFDGTGEMVRFGTEQWTFRRVFMGVYAGEKAQQRQLCLQTKRVMFVNTPCYVGQLRLLSSISKRFLLKTAPFCVQIQNSKQKAVRRFLLLLSKPTLG